MSGGSFNYLYSKLENEPLERSNLSVLRDMIDMLEYEGEPEAASTLSDFYKELKKKIDELDQFLNERILPLQPLMKRAEWWISQDSSHDEFQREYVRYLLTKGEYVKALKYHRRVNELWDMEGFQKAKEEVQLIKEGKP